LFWQIRPEQPENEPVSVAVREYIAQEPQPIVEKVMPKKTEAKGVVAQIVPRAKVFWGNRGYLVKDGKSTYLPAAVREALKKEWERENKQGF
jgi:hypothetical protein